MATADEALGAPTPLGSALKAGIDAISNQQNVTFLRYSRKVLPIDGYVFWIRSDLVAPPVAPLTLTAMGSLHYATDMRQEESESIGVDTIIFTSEMEVADLNDIATDTLWLATVQDDTQDGGNIRYAFSSRAPFYQQADTYHYRGTAVYPDMEPQIIDDLGDLSALQIVSNSLPIWLSMNGASPGPGGFSNPVTLYPSFLVPGNLRPPFASVHIPPENTAALGMAPVIAPDGSHSQLCSDRVRITLYGVDNDDAMTFVDFVNQFSLESDIIGIMGNVQPVMRDEKRTQAEMLTIAKKKTIDFEVSYQQFSARSMGRQLILKVVPNYYPRAV